MPRAILLYCHFADRDATCDQSRIATSEKVAELSELSLIACQRAFSKVVNILKAHMTLQSTCSQLTRRATLSDAIAQAALTLE